MQSLSISDKHQDLSSIDRIEKIARNWRLFGLLHKLLSVPMTVYLYVCVYICVWMCVYICVHECMCMYVCICMCVYVYVCVYACVCVWVCLWMYVHACVSVCMYAWVFVCVSRTYTIISYEKCELSWKRLCEIFLIRLDCQPHDCYHQLANCGHFQIATPC